MNNRTHILSILVFLLFLATSNVRACSTTVEKPKSENLDACSSDTHTEDKSCCDSETDKEDEGCRGTCNHNLCHCPVVVNTPVFFNGFEVKFSNFNTELENNLAYIQQIPKLVYLPIWQRPKIG
ncbi:hypothetical protein QSE00_09485 [Arenibacter sp. M-2]|uniref:hypothetical protein n=1 Tax=Arenibacter sp. M-2 TaxID=3053612 RepID=UPI0025702DE0|nr:hypothetical protein [Arenibacter sp. M-2]MDL5512044.1 hypothetical protein [Arenibacter sp. M-2]